MWGVALIFIAVANCNAELYQLKTTDLPSTADNRIIGGTATTIQQFPFMAQVLYTSQYGQTFCGGSLVTTRHVLSAAHCFDDNTPSRYSIREGTTIFKSGGTVHLVTAITVHELYNATTSDNDVAVVLMATAVDQTTSVARIAFIPYQNSVVPNNSSVTAVGWGVTNAASSVVSTVLNQVTVRTIDQTTCQARYILHNVTSSMICAGILDVGGKDACQGDSGGPLTYNGVVVGITSWGYGCAEPNYPGVYTRVASYTNWINNTINGSLLDLEIQTVNGTSNVTYPGNTGSLSSKVGAITLLAPLLYIIFSV